MATLGVLGGGCGPKGATGKSADGSKTPQKEAPSKPQSIKTGLGSSLFTGTKGERLWKVYWKSAIATFVESTGALSATGDLTGVSGDIYKDSKTACKFTSERGSADKAKKILILTGSVKLVAFNPDATLLCDRMEYDAKLKIVKAFGHIRVLGTANTEGTIDELWATPDLKKLATPDMFYRQ